MTFLTYIAGKTTLHRAAGLKRRLARLAGRSEERQVTVFPKPIPNRIWIYWDKGETAAPPLVQRCIRSWRENNPDWDIVVLDKTTHLDWIDMPDLPATISPNHYANVVRMRLLATHGGVWTDATTFCSQALEDWLPVLAQNGFFAFSWLSDSRAFFGPGPKRTIANWFLASAQDGVIIEAWDRLTRQYWDGRAKATHYFWHNDAFEWLLRSDSKVRQAWEQTPKLSAVAPHLAWHFLQTGRDEAAVRAALATGSIPIHKLSWRMTDSPDEIEALIDRPLEVDGAEG